MIKGPTVILISLLILQISAANPKATTTTKTSPKTTPTTTPTTPPPPAPVCKTCQDGVLALKNAIPKIADFLKITIGTIINKVCDHILPEFDFLEAFCHVIDKNVEDRIYGFLMAFHDLIDEKQICHNLSFCPIE